MNFSSCRKIKKKQKRVYFYICAYINIWTNLYIEENLKKQQSTDKEIYILKYFIIIFLYERFLFFFWDRYKYIYKLLVEKRSWSLIQVRLVHIYKIWMQISNFIQWKKKRIIIIIIIIILGNPFLIFSTKIKYKKKYLIILFCLLI